MSDRPTSLTGPEPQTEPETIEAVPLRRPGRWIAGIVVAVLLALFLYGAATNEAYRWDVYAQYLFDRRITEAAWKTVQLTVLAMLLAVLLGVLLAVMRLSPNPVLKTVSWVYLWIFRGTPSTCSWCSGACSPRSTNNSTSASRSCTSSCTSTCRASTPPSCSP